jgi:hypothetical protein
MTSSPQQAGDRPRTAFPLVLELSLADGDPVSGTVGAADAQPAMPFHGWIDLMSAINSLRAEAVSLRSPQADGRQPPAAHEDADEDTAAVPASKASGNEYDEAS